MTESLCHCEEWERLQKAEAGKGFIMCGGFGHCVERSASLFARVSDRKIEQTPLERMVIDFYPLYIAKIER